MCPTPKSSQIMSQGDRLYDRHEISNHDPTLLFWKLKLCFPIYNHFHQPMKNEGDQDEYQSYCWLLLMHDILVQHLLDNSLGQN